MSIKASCGNCNSSFNAKDSLAGKRVKCPKCKKPLMVPNPKPVTTGAAGLGYIDPIAELLDEANVKSFVRGAGCPDCGAEIEADAIICVECGFNQETGKRLKTRTGSSRGGDEVEDVGLTDADKIMRKAEEEIDDTPIVSDGEDFGDGGDSFVIAGVAGGILLVIVAIALVIILTMEQISEFYNSAFISLLASGGLWAGMTLWIGYVALRAKPIHGIACVATAGLYAIFFGFVQGKSLLVPTICLIAAMVIGLASGAYVFYNGIHPVDSQLIGPAPQFQLVEIQNGDLPSVFRNAA